MVGLSISFFVATCGSSTATTASPSLPVKSAPPVSPVPALSVKLTGPTGLAVDAAGNLYLSECGAADSAIYRIDPLGQDTRFAGSGPIGFDGDGGPATLAVLGCPVGMAFGPDGALYFADHVNNRIRRVDRAGIITTVAGSGAAGVNQGSFSGDGGPAVNATLQEPVDVAFDSAGSLYIADRDNQRVRKVVSSGMISTVAGNGTRGLAGDGGPAAAASLSNPLGIAVDAAGNLLIADSGNFRVRKVDVNGVISTYVGTGIEGVSGDGGPATAATITEPEEVAFDPSGALIVATLGWIRGVDRGGTISTIAGRTGIGQRVDGVVATQASFAEIHGIVFDAEGNLLVADAYNGVWRIDSKGVLARIVGQGP